MEVFGGKPGHVDGCTGWCFLSSCIVVAQPIFSDAQVCPLHQVMDVLCKHHNVGRKVDGNPNPLVRGKKSKVGPSTRLRNRRHLGTTRENSRKVWIIGMDRHGFFLWMRFRFLGKWRPSGLRRWPENPIEQQVYIYISLGFQPGCIHWRGNQTVYRTCCFSAAAPLQELIYPCFILFPSWSSWLLDIWIDNW